MKNKFKLIGIIAFVAIIGFVMVSCGGDNAKPVKEVNVTAMTGDGGTQSAPGAGSYLIQWEARGKHVDAYAVYFMQKDKNSSVVIVASGTNKVVYSSSNTGTTSVNTDLDKWNARVFGNKDPVTGGTTLEGYFGVRAVSLGGESDYSKITWSKNAYKINVSSSGLSN